MRSLRIAALAIIFSLVGTSAHSNTPPLPGFNADGSANTNLPAPIEPPGFLAPLPPPLFNQDGTPFVVGSKLEMPIRADGTRLEYNFDPVSGLYIPVQGNTPINPVVPPPIVPPGFLAPLPPPLFNSD